MKRFLDIVLAVMCLVISFLPMILIAIIVKITSPGPIIYSSERIGVDNKIFVMPKFRTMRNKSPQIATHLMLDPKKYLTPIGSFLRKTSLDELPQLWSILIGNMSMVGPRPALFNQKDLIKLRQKKNIHKLRPGLTGLAQINGRDNLSIDEKVSYDLQYNNKKSTLFDLYIILLTIKKIFTEDSISH
jgi:O-antigen biosynthesis protein WbqP